MRTVEEFKRGDDQRNINQILFRYTQREEMKGNSQVKCKRIILLIFFKWIIRKLRIISDN